MAILVAWSGNTFGQGVFTSNATGNWNDAGSWTFTGTDADGIPDADDNVTISSVHIITVSASTTVECNNLTVAGAGATSLTMAGANSIVNIYGTLNATTAPTGDNYIDCRADVTAKVVFKRTTNGALFGATWAATGTGFRFEVNLPAGITGTTTTGVKGREIIITSGIFSLASGLRPDTGVANGGILTIQDGSTVIVTAAISRTGTTNTPFASLTMNGTGKIIINGTFATPLPTVVSSFPVYTYSSGAVIEYQGGTQAIADISYPNLTITAGTKTWTVGAIGRTVGNISVNGTALLSLAGGTPITVNGNIAVASGATISHGSSANRFVASGAGRTFTLNGTARVTANETQTPAATSPFSYQYNNFATYTFAPSSWISFRSPTTAAITQGIDGITGSPFGNIEIAAITNLTAAGSNTHTFKTNVNIAGILAFPRIVANTSLIINFGANTVKVGGTIQLSGSNTSTQSGGRTYNMGTSTIELNGATAQNTLGGTDLPQTFNNLTINNAAGVTVSNPITVNGTTTINDGSKLAMGATLNTNGAVAVNGTFQLNASGWATGSGIWTYGSNGTLAFNTAYGVNSDHVYWPTTNGPVNVSVSNGVLTLNSGTNRTVSGLFQTSNGVAMSGATLTLNGTAQINAGGYFSNAPTFGSSSTLKYNTGTTYGRGTEWNNPANVQISNNTILDYPNTAGNAFSTNLSLTGNLTVDTGSSLYMDYGGSSNKSSRLTVAGNVVLNGNLSLGNAVGGDLYVGGNWTRAASGSAFGTNSREVRFNGLSDQSISNTGGETFAYLTVDNSAGKVLTLNDNVTVANNLTINGGSALSLSNEKSLNVTGDFTINSTSNGTGTFVDNGTTVVSGATKVNQYLSSYRSWYMSSPVSGAVTPSDNNSAAPALLKWYDETKGDPTGWTLATDMTAGKGYLLNPGTLSVASTINFSGTLNNGNIPVDLTRSNVTKAGFNLIGNPYPSHIVWTDEMATSANLLSSIWYRTAVYNVDHNVYSFNTYNSAGSIAVPVEATPYIPPMQGFWVRVNDTHTTGQLTFTNAMRHHKDANALKAPAAKNSDNQVLRLKVVNGSVSDEAVVYINAKAANTYDTYDSPKMLNGSTSTVPDMYTMAGTEQLVINGLNTIPDEIPLYFKANASTVGQFSLSATEVSNFEAGTLVYIKNSKTGEQQLISDGSVYSFDKASDPTLSIIIKVPGAVTGLGSNNSAALNVYANAKGQITVAMPSVKASDVVSVYNSAGQCLMSQSLASTRTVLNKTFTSGVYVVRVNDVTRKVVVE